MSWEVPITVGDEEYPVTFNTEHEPTESDIHEALSKILQSRGAPAPRPSGEEPGYMSQLGTALSIGGRQMAAGVKGTFNAATGDVPDTAEAMARMAALGKEQQAAQTGEDIAINEDFAKNKEEWQKAGGVWPATKALAGYAGSIASHPGAAFKQAIQSAPNAVIGTGTSLAGYGLGAVLGAGAGAETGPGAILTGLAGAAAGGAVSNSLMEAGPAIYDILNERTNGAAAGMTADQISEVLKKDPTIVSEGLKTGAIRGSVIGLIEGLGMKGAGALMTIPERAAARAAQKTLLEAGVDLASKEAVKKAMENATLKQAVSAAAQTAKAQYSTVGNLARGAGAVGIETAASGAGEIGAQVAAGQPIDPTAAVQEMMGEVGVNAATAPFVKAYSATKSALGSGEGGIKVSPNTLPESAGLGRPVIDVIAEADALSAKAHQQAVKADSPLLAQAIAQNAAAPTPEAQAEETGKTAEPSETQEPGAADETTETLSDTEVKPISPATTPGQTETPTSQDNATQQEPIQEGVLKERQNRDQSRETPEAGSRNRVQRPAEGQEEVAPTAINNVALMEQGHVDQHAGESRTPAEGSISDVTSEKVPDNKSLSSITGTVTLDPEQLSALTPNPAEIEQAITDNQQPQREAMDLGKADPIMVIRQKDGTLKVVQGHHRLARALRDKVPLRVDISNEVSTKPISRTQSPATSGTEAAKSVPERINESSLSPRTTYPSLVQDIKNLTGNTPAQLQEVADALLPEPMTRPTAEKIARRLMDDNRVDREANASRDRALERDLLGEEKQQRGEEKPISDNKAPLTQGEFVTWQDENGVMREGVLTKASAGRNGLGESMSEVTLENSEVLQVPRRELQPLMASLRPEEAARDAEYMQAVKDGDVAKQQAMVDAAAGGRETLYRGQHGVKNQYSDKKPIFFTRNEQLAAGYARSGGYKEEYYSSSEANEPVRSWKGERVVNVNPPPPTKQDIERYKSRGMTDDDIAFNHAPSSRTESLVVHSEKGAEDLKSRGFNVNELPVKFKSGPTVQHAKLFVENPLVIDAKGSLWNEIKFEGNTHSTDSLAEIAKNTGHDGLIVKNVRDSFAGIRGDNLDEVHAVFSPNQIKSADPITRDAEGNVIPLSERFNDQSNDIRFSLARGSPAQQARAEAIKSIRGTLGTELSTGVSAVDAINGAAGLQGQVPGVQKAWIGTRADFLADEKLGKAFPVIKRALESSKGDRLEGLFAGGRAFVFTDQVGIFEGDVAAAAEQTDVTPGQAAVQRVITHEALVHRGFYALDPATRRALFQWGMQNIYEAEMDAKAEEYGHGTNWRTDEASREFLLEEIMAKMIERLKAPPKSGPLKQLWDILAAIWRKLSGRSREVTLKDIQDVAKLLRTALELAENNVQTRSGMPVRVDVAKPSMRPEQDAEYMQAVKDGDVAKQQVMVDAAAKAAGYTDGPFLHGTKKHFTVFERPKNSKSQEMFSFGHHFTDSPELASQYGDRMVSAFLKYSNGLDTEVVIDKNSRLGQWVDSINPKMRWFPDRGNRVVYLRNALDELPPKKLEAELRKAGYDALRYKAKFQELGAGYMKDIAEGATVVVFDPSQIKSADPITRDAEGNIIPLSERFNTASDDIRFSIRPTYTSPLDQTLANTAKAVRLMRDGPPTVPVNLQQVYREAQVGKSSAMVSLDDLFATAKKAHPDLTEAEFGRQLQALYDDNGAYIEPAESPAVMRESGDKYNVRANGIPATFAMVLETERPPMASFRPEVAERLARQVQEAQGASGDITESEQTPTVDRPVHTFAQQSGEARVQAAVQIVDALESENVPKEEWVDEITSPAFLRQLGIDRDPDMLSILLAEAMRRDAPGAFSTYEVTRERAGRALGSGAMLHSHPRYQHLFVLNGIKKEHQQQATDIAEANADIKDHEIKKLYAEFNKTAGTEMAESAEDAAFRAGEEGLSKENKPLWQEAKNLVTRIGAAMMKLAARKAKNAAEAKPSIRGVITQAELDAMDSMTDEELEASIAKDQKKLTSVLKKIRGDGTPKAKASPEAGRIATLVNRLSEQLGVPTDITTAVEALTASQDNLRNQFEQGIVNSLVGKVRAAVTPKQKPSKNINSVIRQITRILADNLNLPTNATGKESLGEKALDAFGRVRNNEQLIREAWDKAREQIRATLAKRATEGLEGLTEEEAADIEQQMDDQLATIAAEVPAHLWARGQAFGVIRDALAETTFDNSAKILADPEAALKAAQGKINEAVEKVGNVDPARWASNQPYIIAAFNQLVADLRVAKAKSDSRRKAAQKAGVFSPAETKTFNRLFDVARKRSGDKTPLLPENISWSKLFSGSPQSQEAKAKQMMEYMKEDPVLSNLTLEEQQELADMFAKQWEAKRLALTEAKVAAVLKRRHATEKGKEAVKGAIPKFIQAINRGELTQDLIAQDIAEKFGFEKLTDAENKKLETLAKELQEPDISVHDRRAKTDEIVKIIARKTGLSKAEILSAWWVTSVLSGPRTIFTIGMAFLSGGFEVFTHAAATVINAHLQGRRSEGTAAAMQAITNYFKSYPRAVQLAWQYVRTGDKNLLADSDPAFMQFFDTGRNNPQSIGWRMTQSKNSATRMLGRFMHFFEKMLTAGDLFNSTITRHGMLPVAQFLNSKSYDKARVADETDLANYRKKALNQWWGGNEPKTWQQQALVTRQSIDLMEAVLAKYANVLEDANFVAAQSAMTLNPEGAGGKAYRAIRGIANRAETSSAKAVKTASMLKADEVGAANKMAQQGIAFLYHFATHQMLNVAGLRFARFAGNKLNQSIGFVPLLGLARLYEKDYAGQIKSQAIIKNQVIGAVIAMVGITILKAVSDEPDDEKRGWGIEGSWAGLSADKIKQLMAAGRKQNSIHFGEHTFNYANWPVSSVLAAFGAMADRIKYNPKDWKEANSPEVAYTGLWAAMTSTFDTTALSQLSEILGSNVHSRDPVDASIKKVSRVFGNFAGGFIPRVFKDIDLMGDGKLRKYEGWENFAKEVPYYRRYVGGPLLDIFGKQVEVSRTPWSREYQVQPEAREYRLLGQLGSRGLWMTPADPGNRRVGRGKRSREMTDAEQKRFVTIVGDKYREVVLKHGDRLTKMPYEAAKDMLGKLTAQARDRAERAALVTPATQP